MSLSPLASSCRAAVELFGAPVVLQEGSINKSRHVRSSSNIQQHQQRHTSTTQTIACAALFVAASARCRPRSSTSSSKTGALRFAPALTKGRLRKRRRGSGMGNDDDGFSNNWDDEAWQHLWNGDNSGGDNNGNNGWGRGWGSGGSGSDPFHRVLFEWLWVWQLVCVASMLQSWYFMLFPRQTMVDLEAAQDATELVRARVGMAY